MAFNSAVIKFKSGGAWHPGTFPCSGTLGPLLRGWGLFPGHWCQADGRVWPTRRHKLFGGVGSGPYGVNVVRGGQGRGGRFFNWGRWRRFGWGNGRSLQGRKRKASLCLYFRGEASSTEVATRGGQPGCDLVAVFISVAWCVVGI